MSACAQRLIGLTKELNAAWTETRDAWNDAKSREFEERFLDKLQTEVNQATLHIDALERLLAKIRSDCQAPAERL